MEICGQVCLHIQVARTVIVSEKVNLWLSKWGLVVPCSAGAALGSSGGDFRT